jgi:hypothetical protein
LVRQLPIPLTRDTLFRYDTMCCVLVQT